MGAIAGAAVAAYGAYSSSQVAGEAADAQGKAMDAQTALAMRQQDMADEQYARYKDLYAPMEEELIGEAREGIDADRFVGLATTDVGQQFNTQRTAQRQQMERYGLSPASGAWQGGSRQLGISEALGKSQAANAARMGIEDTNWSRRTGLLAQGQGLQNSAAAGYGSAASSMGSVASGYGGTADMYSGAAGDWTKFGLNVADKAGWFNQNQSGIAGVNRGSQQDQMLAAQWS